MKNILILPNRGKPIALEFVNKLIPFLQNRDFIPVLEQEMALALNLTQYGRIGTELLNGIDLVLVLGGDGSMLNAARMVYPFQIPLLGVNLGHLGFLTVIESHHLESALDELSNGNFHYEDRTMIEARVYENGNVLQYLAALNDLVVAKNYFNRIIRLKTWIDDEYITTYPADGLIVATATGSTAYSLSAGGPILDPRMKAIIMTPICAHSLYARPMVLNDTVQIKVLLEAGEAEVRLTADGQAGIVLQPDHEIYFQKAEAVTRLLRFNNQGLYETLKSRLKEGRI